MKRTRRWTGPCDRWGRFAKAIEAMNTWLDAEVADTYKGQPLAQDWARVAKLGEEMGEAISALIGYTGQNPRKGTYSSRDEMLGELADCALTAIYAIQHFTGDVDKTIGIIQDKAAHHIERCGLSIDA